MAVWVRGKENEAPAIRVTECGEDRRGEEVTVQKELGRQN